MRGAGRRVTLPGTPQLQARYRGLLMWEKEDGPNFKFYPEGATRKYKVCELLDGVRRDEIPSRVGMRG